MPEWLADKSTFDIVSFVVGVLGLIVGAGFGYKQYRDLGRTRSELGTLNDRLIELQNRSLTIAIARFPLNLGDLTAFIENTHTELAIMCDFIGYAMYSNASDYPRYLKALIEAKTRGVKIRLLLYGLDTARQAIGRQLPPTNYLTIRESEPCKAYFTLNHEGTGCPNSYDEFRDALLRDEEALVDKIGNVELKVINHNLLAFAWIADQTKACIFSFRNSGNNEAGMTFRSQDTQIASDFRTVFQSEWETASGPLYKGRW